MREISWLDRTVPVESAALRARLADADSKANDIKQLVGSMGVCVCMCCLYGAKHD